MPESPSLPDAAAPTQGATDLCPAWCRTTHTGESWDVRHDGPSALFVPSAGARPSAAGTEATVMSLIERPEDLLRTPIVFVSGRNEDLELDLPGLDEYIAGMEQYLTGLRALRGQFAEILACPGTLQQEDSRPLVERTSPCPPWCINPACRDGSRHDRQCFPSDRYHYSDTHSLRPTEESRTVIQVDLVQQAFAHRPDVVLSIDTDRDDACTTLTLDEARTLAAVVGSLTTRGERDAEPACLPPLPDVLISVGAQVFEDPGLARNQPGYTLGRVSQDRQVLVVVPRGLSTEHRERLVREQLGDESHREKRTAARAEQNWPPASLPEAA